MVILIIQVILILVGTFGFLNYSSNKVKPTPVYIYARTIDDSSKAITEDDVKRVEIPESAVTKDMCKKIDDIVGKYADTKVSKGQYVYKNQLVDIEDIDVFKTLDLGNLRKVSLPITFVDGFAGNIKKGDTVDLVYTGEGTHDDEDGKQETFKYSKVFLQDVLVYSVNTGDGYKFVDYSQYSPDDYIEGEEISVDEKKQDLSIITLAVTLEQAEEIEARVNSGKVRFIGRFDDSKSYNTLGYIMGDYQKIFTGQGHAETGNVLVEEDDFDSID